MEVEVSAEQRERVAEAARLLAAGGFNARCDGQPALLPGQEAVWLGHGQWVIGPRPKPRPKSTRRPTALGAGLLVVLAALAGCGDGGSDKGPLADITNRPGPWPVEVEVRYSTPREPDEAVYRLEVVREDDPGQAFVSRAPAGDNQATTVVFSVRPGTYTVVAALIREGRPEVEVKRVPASFTMGRDGRVTPSRPRLDL